MGFQMSEFEFQTSSGGFLPPPYLGKSPQFSRFLIMMPPLSFIAFGLDPVQSNTHLYTASFLKLQVETINTTSVRSLLPCQYCWMDQENSFFFTIIPAIYIFITSRSTFHMGVSA